MAKITDEMINKKLTGMQDDDLELDQVKNNRGEMEKNILLEVGSIVGEGEKYVRSENMRPFICRYPEEQTVSGYRFQHISGGLYYASPEFVIAEDELAEMLLEYTEICLSVKKEDSGRYRVVYGYAPGFSQLYIPDVSVWKMLAQLDGRLMRNRKRFLGAESIDYTHFLTEEEKEKEKKLLEEKHQKRSPKKRTFEWEIPENDYGKWIYLGSVLGEEVEEGIYAIRDPRRYIFDSVNVSYFYEGVELAEVCLDSIAGEKGIWAACTRNSDYDRAPWLREQEWQLLVDHIAVGEENLPKLNNYLQNDSEVIRIL